MYDHGAYVTGLIAYISGEARADFTQKVNDPRINNNDNIAYFTQKQKMSDELPTPHEEAESSFLDYQNVEFLLRMT